MLKSSILIAMAVYTYLRLIVDHHGTAQLQTLRQKEVDFCISLLRERVRDQDKQYEEVMPRCGVRVAFMLLGQRYLVRGAGGSDVVFSSSLDSSGAKDREPEWNTPCS